MNLNIRHDITYLKTTQQLARNEAKFSKSFQRLSTGQRINQAQDDPSALISSIRKRSQLQGIKTSITNTQNAISMAQTAEAALDESANLLVKIQGLALKASQTGTYSQDEIAAMQAEVDQAINSIAGISRNTRFANQNLLDGSLQPEIGELNQDLKANFTSAHFSGSSKRLNLIVNTAATQASVDITLNTSGQLDNNQTLKFSGDLGSTTLSFAAKSEGQDIAEVISETSSQTGVYATYNATTKKISVQSISYGNQATVQVDDLDGTNDLLTFIGSRDFHEPQGYTIAKVDSSNTTVKTALESATFGTTDTSVTTTSNSLYIALRDAADAIQTQILSTAKTAITAAIKSGTTTAAGIDTAIKTAVDSDSTLTTLFSNLNTASQNYEFAFGPNTGIGLNTGVDLAKEALLSTVAGFTDTLVASEYTFNTHSINAEGTQGSATLNGVSAEISNLELKFNSNDIHGSIYLDSTSNTASYSSSFTLNSSGALLQLGIEGRMSHQLGVSLIDLTPGNLGKGNYVNPDFNPNANTSSTNSRTVYANLSHITDGGSFSLSKHADLAYKIASNALSEINQARANLGALISSRLQKNIDILSTSNQHLTASESLIRDTDMAFEVSQFTQKQITLQASTSVASQASYSSQIVLQFLDSLSFV